MRRDGRSGRCPAKHSADAKPRRIPGVRVFDYARAVVNAERSAYRAPAFAVRIGKTRTVLLQELIQTYLPE